MTGLIGARLLLVASSAVSPSPFPGSSGGRVGPFIPSNTQPNPHGAGLAAFGVVLLMIALSVLLFLALNRSLRRARRNLGGDVLPRRRPTGRPTIPPRKEP